MKTIIIYFNLLIFVLCSSSIGATADNNASQSLKEVKKLLRGDEDQRVKAVELLGTLRPTPQVVDLFDKLSYDQSQKVRKATTLELEKAKFPQRVTFLRELLSDIFVYGNEGLAYRGFLAADLSGESLEMAKKKLNIIFDKKQYISTPHFAHIVEGLGNRSDEESLKVLKDFFDNIIKKDPKGREDKYSALVFHALAKRMGPAALELLPENLTDYRKIRFMSPDLGDQAIEYLLKISQHPKYAFRWELANALQNFNSPKILPVFENLYDNEGSVQEQVAKSLKNYSGAEAIEMVTNLAKSKSRDVSRELTDFFKENKNTIWAKDFIEKVAIGGNEDLRSLAHEVKLLWKEENFKPSIEKIDDILRIISKHGRTGIGDQSHTHLINMLKQLGQKPGWESYQILKYIAKRGHFLFRRHVLKSLGKMNDFQKERILQEIAYQEGGRSISSIAFGGNIFSGDLSVNSEWLQNFLVGLDILLYTNQVVTDMAAGYYLTAERNTHIQIKSANRRLHHAIRPTKSYLLRRLFVQNSPGKNYGRGGIDYSKTIGHWKKLVDEISKLIPKANDLHSDFYDIRNIVHRGPTPKVLKSSQVFLEKYKKQKNPDPVVIEKVNEHIEISKVVFDERDKPVDELANLASTPQIHIDAFNKAKNSKQKLVALLNLGTNLRAKIKEVRKNKGLRSIEVDLTRTLDHALKKVFNFWPEVLEQNKIDVDTYFLLAKNMYLEGYLSTKEYERVQKALANLKEEHPNDLLRQHAYLRYLSGLGQQRLRNKFKKALLFVKEKYPETKRFIDKQVAASSLLHIGEVVMKVQEKLPASKTKFVPMTTASACGIVNIVRTQEQVDALYNDMHSIFVLGKGLSFPLEKTVFAGILTEDHMTDGSHPVVLSRGDNPRPCATIDGICQELTDLDGKPIRLEVTQDGYKVTPLSDREYRDELKKSKELIKKKERAVAFKRSKNELIDLKQLSGSQTALIGAKASNYGELNRLLGDQHTYPGLALPLESYHQFMQENDLQKKVDSILADDSVLRDPKVRSERLRELRSAIMDYPLPPQLLKEIKTKLQAKYGENTKMRFRSSANAEDMPGFSGAGLYKSQAAFTGNEVEMEEAVKNVWASLWTDRAFESRVRAGIDQKSVKMGVLIHPSYRKEQANGVAFTGNNKHKVFAQIGKESVTNSTGNAIPETYMANTNDDSIEYENLSNATGGEIVMQKAWRDQLRSLMTKIHGHFGRSMDIEFKIEDGVKVKQARPAETSHE